MFTSCDWIGELALKSQMVILVDFVKESLIIFIFSFFGVLTVSIALDSLS